MVDFAVWKKGRHRLIAGIGVIALGDLDFCPSPHSPGYCRDGRTDWMLAAEAGYRFQAHSGFFFKATAARSPNPSHHYTDREPGHLILPAWGLGWSF